MMQAEFPVPASVAGVGGTIEVKLPGATATLQVQVPPGLQVGDMLRVNLPAGAGGAGAGSSNSINNNNNHPRSPLRQQQRSLGDEVAQDCNKCCSCSGGGKGGGLTGEQQYILASILAGAIGLVVGVTVLTTSLNLENYVQLVVGVTLLILLLVLELFIETRCAPRRYKPAMLAFSVLLCHLVMLLFFLSVSPRGRSGLEVGWAWGLAAGGLAVAHTRQILSHQQSAQEAAQQQREEDEEEEDNDGGARGEGSGAWFLSRLLSQGLPFVCVWVYALVDYGHFGNRSPAAEETARHLSCALCAVGALVPTFLPDAAGAFFSKSGSLSKSGAGAGVVGVRGGQGDVRDVRELSRTEAHQSVWVLLVFITFGVLLPASGGGFALRFASPLAFAAVAALFFPLAALLSRAEGESGRRAQPLLPLGLSVSLLAVGLLVVAIATCAVEEAGNPGAGEGHGAAAPFLALLAGTVSHYTIDASDRIHKVRQAGPFVL